MIYDGETKTLQLTWLKMDIYVSWIPKFKSPWKQNNVELFVICGGRTSRLGLSPLDVGFS